MTNYNQCGCVALTNLYPSVGEDPYFLLQILTTGVKVYKFSTFWNKFALGGINQSIFEYSKCGLHVFCIIFLNRKKGDDKEELLGLQFTSPAMR